MGCGNSKEKLEDEMLNLKISRIEVQMERYNQMQILKEKNGYNIKYPEIPDYLDHKYAINMTKRNSNSTNIKEIKKSSVGRRSKSFKTKRNSFLSSKNVKSMEPEKGRSKRSKSVAIKLGKIDENEPNAKKLKAKRRNIILGKENNK